VEFSQYFEWGGLNTNGTPGFAANRPGWPMPIRDLLLTNKAQAFFHGHDHLYVKQDYFASGNTSGVPDFIYQEVPQPSHFPYNATNSTSDPNYNYTNGVLYGSSGHLRVTVSPTNAIVDYIRSYRPSDEGAGKTNRMIAYSYNIPAAVATPFILFGSIVSNKLVLQWNSQPGFSYTVQRSDNLTVWSNIFVGQTNYWIDANSVIAAPKQFYRVQR
jgi:hypothetical protein